MQPTEPNDEERLEQLPEDGQTPFQPADPGRNPDAPADDVAQVMQTDTTTHPAADTGIDEQQSYDEGSDSAAGITEPNAGNAVTDYDKPTQ